MYLLEEGTAFPPSLPLMVTKNYQLAPQISPFRNRHPPIVKGTLFITSSFTSARLKLINYQNVLSAWRRTRVRAKRPTTRTQVDCIENEWQWCVRSRRRGDAVGPFPDIVKQVVFKIEKLTKRVHGPKAPAALPQPKLCHLLERRSAQRGERTFLVATNRHEHAAGWTAPTTYHTLLTNTQQHLQTLQKIFSIEAAHTRPRRDLLGMSNLPSSFVFSSLRRCILLCCVFCRDPYF